MALPAQWQKTRERPVWDASAGWSVIHTYEGPATETQLVAIPAEFPSATRLEFDKDPYKDDGSQVTYWVELQVTYAAGGPDGQSRPPSDPDYGLYSRNWELDFESEQVPITEGRLAEDLLDADPNWVARIDLLAARYRTQMSEYLKGQTGGASAALEPQMGNYLPLVRTGSAALNAIAQWMWDKLRSNPDYSEVIEAPTLRKTEVVAAFANVHASNVNCRRVFRYTKLVSTETTIEAAVLLDLSKLKSDWPYWLKRRPRVELSSQGRFTITQEYSGLAAYDSVQYGPPL